MEYDSRQGSRRADLWQIFVQRTRNGVMIELNYEAAKEGRQFIRARPSGGNGRRRAVAFCAVTLLMGSASKMFSIIV